MYIIHQVNHVGNVVADAGMFIHEDSATSEAKRLAFAWSVWSPSRLITARVVKVDENSVTTVAEFKTTDIA